MTTQTMRSHAEFELLMTPFETRTERVPEQFNGGAKTSTGPTIAQVLTFPVPGPTRALPTPFTSLSQYVAESEQDVEFKKALSDARKKFALDDRLTTLRHMRLSKGMSQAQLAMTIGTSQPHIARIEAARLDPTYETFDKLARAFEVDIADVVHAFGASKGLATSRDAAP